jgi:NitT/TauT family transport system ATP-binding protein
VTQIVQIDLQGPRDLKLINTEAFGAYVAGIRANLQATGGLD